MLIANLLPFLTVKAVLVECLVVAVIEVCLCAEIYLGALEQYLFLYLASYIALIDGAAHHDMLLAVDELNAYIAVAVLEDGETGAVAVLHAASVE